MPKIGIVYLVGAGPGDPGLMTVKGLECLRKADVVIYDYLANPEFLKISKSALKIYAGKKGSSHSREQDEINHLMTTHAKRGRTVVRLKGGDPFLFGRGGEEAEALAAAGIPFEIVPGVTSAIAVPAYAGIPVTHRNYTPSVAFVTGHKEEDRHDWRALSRIGTVVFLMGYSNTPKIARCLLKAGRSPKTPVAVIEWGTYPRQRRVIGTLATITNELKKTTLGPPTIIVVGDVVGLADKLSWYQKPLLGKKILVTRSRSQASELTRLLQEQGATVFECPTIEILSPRSWKNFDRSLKNLRDYDDLIFTSANGVRFFFERMKKQKASLRQLRIAVVGQSTAAALKEFGFKAQVIAKEFNARSLLQSLLRKKMKGRRVLFARAEAGRDILVEGLKKAGAYVDLVEVYRSQIPAKGRSLLRKVLKENQIDLVTFASSLTAENFLRMGIASPRWIRETPAAVIGPVTAKTARSLGFKKVLQPARATMGDWSEAIRKFFKAPRVSE